MKYLTFALAKGRLAKKTLDTFRTNQALRCEEMKDAEQHEN